MRSRSASISDGVDVPPLPLSHMFSPMWFRYVHSALFPGDFILFYCTAATPAASPFSLPPSGLFSNNNTNSGGLHKYAHSSSRRYSSTRQPKIDRKERRKSWNTHLRRASPRIQRSPELFIGGGNSNSRSGSSGSGRRCYRCYGSRRGRQPRPLSRARRPW